MNKKGFYIIAASLLLAMASCKKSENGTGEGTGNNGNVPDNFDYSTTREVLVNVRILTNDNKPLQGVKFSLFNKNSITTNLSDALGTVVSDADGYIRGTFNVPTAIDTLIANTTFTGLPQNVKVYIQAGQVIGELGGKEVMKGNLIANNNQVGYKVQTPVQMSSTQPFNISFMGSYDEAGVPAYLEKPGDLLSVELMANINYSLPESKDLKALHPDFLKGEANINLVKATDVSMTFVSEGASYLNSLAYYTYPTNKPPKMAGDVKEVRMVFPNASFRGLGGGLKTGDKVKLGNFAAGTSIGFVLLQDAWVGASKTINTNAAAYYSNSELNNEATEYKRHSVLLHDAENDLFVAGFEDQQRDKADVSDEDFNDILFYLKSSVKEAISTKDVSQLLESDDIDGDGVKNSEDMFPKDPTRAYITYFPSQNTWGTLAYEDRWPAEGDYDLNDMVVGYRYKYIKNAKNETVEMFGDYTLRATGASFTNGFGIQFPFSQEKISTVQGQQLISSYIKTNSNQTEAGQDKAVIIPFDDSRALIYQGGFANTRLDFPYKIASDTAHVYILFTSPMSDASLGIAPYNPFLISDRRRGYEVHLAGTHPTSLANKSLFGTEQDDTNEAKGKYYLTKENMPYALSFTQPFEYPAEEVNIKDAYLHFIDWAKSGGATYTDWYSNKASGYRNSSNIYK